MYATGLLANSLVANEACNEAVRNGMAVELAKVPSCPFPFPRVHVRPKEATAVCNNQHPGRKLQLMLYSAKFPLYVCQAERLVSH